LSEIPGFDRRMLVADVGRSIAADLTYYPADVARDALEMALGLVGDDDVARARGETALIETSHDPRRGVLSGAASRFVAAIVLGIGLVFVLLVGWPRAEDGRRVDGRAGERAGTVVVDPKTGRYDAYDEHSRRTEYGRVTEGPSGALRVDRYEVDGRRVGEKRRR
jgi:hypothetical protein